jgi:hypothetical protein
MSAAGGRGAVLAVRADHAGIHDGRLCDPLPAAAADLPRPGPAGALRAGPARTALPRRPCLLHGGAAAQSPAVWTPLRAAGCCVSCTRTRSTQASFLLLVRLLRTKRRTQCWTRPESKRRLADVGGRSVCFPKSNVLLCTCGHIAWEHACRGMRRSGRCTTPAANAQVRAPMQTCDISHLPIQARGCATCSLISRGGRLSLGLR